MADHTDERPMYRMKFLDGTPVPDDYYRQVSKLVRDAADGDPGEIDEAEVLAKHAPHPNA